MDLLFAFIYTVDNQKHNHGSNAVDYIEGRVYSREGINGVQCQKRDNAHKT